MTRRTKFSRAIRGLWRDQTHRYFQEMCALAVTGQLGGAQMCELSSHVSQCDSCRQFLESAAQVSVQVLPLMAEAHPAPADVAPREGMRERFLARLASQNSLEVLRPQPVVLPPSTPQRKPRFFPPTLIPGWRMAASAGAAGLVMGGLAFYAGQRFAVPKTAPLPNVTKSVAPSPPPTVIQAAVHDLDHIAELERQKIALESRLAEMSETASRAETEQKALNDKLAEASAKLATLAAQNQEQNEAERARNIQAIQQANNQSATLRAEAERLRSQLEDARVKLALQQKDTETLRTKLGQTSADLERAQNQKAATTDIGELVAARNLHIIDVYDTDKGKRQRSFGRVFYIEGQSLVFYAYDLDDNRRLDANVVFHVWGEKAGVKETTHSLGILHSDSSGQGRWAMTFDDPRVLAQINSVFVTAERRDKPAYRPGSRKVLYAYFGSQANHP